MPPLPIPPRHLPRLRRMLYEEDLEEGKILGVIVAWRRQRKQRRMWVMPWIQCHQLFGHYTTLMAELERNLGVTS